MKIGDQDPVPNRIFYRPQFLYRTSGVYTGEKVATTLQDALHGHEGEVGEYVLVRKYRGHSRMEPVVTVQEVL